MITVQSRQIQKLENDMGPELMRYLHDPKVVEIMLNADGQVWVERLGESPKASCHVAPAQAMGILTTIAGYHHLEVSATKPILECELPIDGSRFAGQIPPIVPAPTFSIRKKAISVFSLEQYRDSSIISEHQYDVIIDAVRHHRNIRVVGGTGSGKTTLVNAVISKMTDINNKERIVIIEDTGEIQCTAPNYVQFHTSYEVSMTDLLKTTLRMRPDRILVGEVRGPEALDLLMAWNSGHEGGAATLHANDAAAGLSKLELLISMHPQAPRDIPLLVSQCVHLVIHIARTQTGRKVRSIIRLTGFDRQSGKYLYETL